METTGSYVKEYFGRDDEYQLTADRDGFLVESIEWTWTERFGNRPTATFHKRFRTSDQVRLWLDENLTNLRAWADAIDVLEAVEYTWNGEGGEFGPEETVTWVQDVRDGLHPL